MPDQADYKAMDLGPENKFYVEVLAKEVIQRLADIADAAGRALDATRDPSGDALVYPDATNAGQAASNIDRITATVRRYHEHLRNEPAIARVVAIDARGCSLTYYICRTAPVSGIQNLASYRSPVGRLASLPIGDGITLPNGSDLEVTDRATLHPVREQGAWDSVRTAIATGDFGPITVSSLRQYLVSLQEASVAQDILDTIEAEEQLGQSMRA